MNEQGKKKEGVVPHPSPATLLAEFLHISSPQVQALVLEGVSDHLVWAFGLAYKKARLRVPTETVMPAPLDILRQSRL